MRRAARPGLTAVLVLVMFLSLAVTGQASPAEPARIIVAWAADAPAAARAEAHRAMGARVVEQLRIGADVVTAAGPGQEVLAGYRRNPLVRYAVADRLVELTAAPDDTYYGVQWHHPVISSPEAWDSTTGSSGVLIAICDTGVDIDHPDLAPNLRLDLAYNTVDNAPGNVDDRNGHGSGTSGTAGAVGNNGTGVSGVNWNVGIIPVRVSNRGNGGAWLSDITQCVEYAADSGARVINASYSVSDDQPMHDAAVYAEGKGAVTTVSAGNDGSNAGHPDFSSFLAVSATDRADTLASFSNYGSYIDIAAPGVDIATTYKDGQYVYYSGTSFSAPMVAGVLGLMFAVCPDMTAAQAKQVVLDSADDLGNALYFGAGRVNAQAAVAGAQALCGGSGGDPDPGPDPGPDPDPAAPAPPTGVTASSDGPGSLIAAWTDASTDEAGFEVQYGVKVRGSYQWSDAVAHGVADASTTGDAYTESWSGLNRGNYVVRVRAVNDIGPSDWVTSSEVRVK